jgi:hypothetical protein
MAVFVVAVAITVSWMRSRELRRGTEEGLRTLAASRAQLEIDIRRAEERLANAREMPRPSRGEAAPPKPAVSAKPAPAPASSASVIERPPEIQVLMLQSGRNQAMLNYDDLFRQLGASEAQSTKFGDNFAAWQEREMDLTAVMRQQDEAGKRTTAELQRQARVEYEQAQLRSLGEEGYRRLQEYDRTIEVRSTLIRGFAGGAAIAGIPLTAEQSERLVAAGIESAPNGATLPAESLLPAIDWEVFDAKARAILTPAQFQYFMTETPNAGYFPHWKFRLDAAVAKARQAEAATPRPTKPGG